MNSKGENAVERKRRQLRESGPTIKCQKGVIFDLFLTPANCCCAAHELLEELAFVQMQLLALRGYQVENAEKT